MQNSSPNAPISAAARFINRRIYELRSRRAQHEIAAAAGFKSAGMLSMIKLGRAKLPIERVVDLAAALECDARHLTRLALEQSLSQPILNEIFGPANGPCSANESKIIKRLRELSDDSDPQLTPELEKALSSALSSSVAGAPALPANTVSKAGVNITATVLLVEANAAVREFNHAKTFATHVGARMERVRARLETLRVELDMLMRDTR